MEHQIRGRTLVRSSGHRMLLAGDRSQVLRSEGRAALSCSGACWAVDLYDVSWLIARYDRFHGDVQVEAGWEVCSQTAHYGKLTLA